MDPEQQPPATTGPSSVWYPKGAFTIKRKAPEAEQLPNAPPGKKFADMSPAERLLVQAMGKRPSANPNSKSALERAQKEKATEEMLKKRQGVEDRTTKRQDRCQVTTANRRKIELDPLSMSKGFRESVQDYGPWLSRGNCNFLQVFLERKHRIENGDPDAQANEILIYSAENISQFDAMIRERECRLLEAAKRKHGLHSAAIAKIIAREEATGIRNGQRKTFTTKEMKEWKEEDEIQKMWENLQQESNGCFKTARALRRLWITGETLLDEAELKRCSRQYARKYEEFISMDKMFDRNGNNVEPEKSS